MYPSSFWNFFDRIKSNEGKEVFKIQNLGAEYFSFLIDHYFDKDSLITLDIKSVVEKLKLMEHDSGLLFDINTRKEQKIKYKFMPVETHQMLDFLERKTDEEFKRENIIALSEDEKDVIKTINKTN